MPRHKQSIGKEISANDPHRESKALLGVHYKHRRSYEAVVAIQKSKPLYDHIVQLIEELHGAIFNAIKKRDAGFLLVLADLVEIASNGPRSPIEHSLLASVLDRVEITTDKKGKILKVEVPPASISSLRSAVEKRTGTRPSPTATRHAAKRLKIGVKRGRPQEKQATKANKKRRIKAK
jgi:hypothetical protein